ncbi:MAG: 2-C-methyl-D-erythritol 2,4-cyclodiphosphate synthase [Acidimicrobiales bacterium]
MTVEPAPPTGLSPDSPIPGLAAAPAMGLRVGQGFDVHPWSDNPARPLVLGGRVFDGYPGLVGHSDADVIAHACTDALLGASGLGDIGSLFPDDDPALAGADSVALLSRVVAHLAGRGWAPVNIDCTVVLDEPKLAPHRDEIEARLTAAVGAPVTVKGKRTEQLPGLAGGIQCHAVALVIQDRGEQGW